MKQFIRKADIILLIALVIAGLAASAVLALHRGESTDAEAKVVIKSGGKLFAEYPLSEDRDVDVPADPGENLVRIEGGEVSVVSASCKNQVCVKHGAISKPGESIVCLPNRLVVSIESSGSGKGGGYDSVSS